MAKYKFTKEYELRASPKMLFQYLSTPAGLSDWFAEEVNIDDQKQFNFIWDREDHLAKISAQRLNKSIKFEFVSKLAQEEQGAAYIEFRLEHNELTDSTFLKIIDYSEMDNDEDLTELWDGLLENLREKVGG